MPAGEQEPREHATHSAEFGPLAVQIERGSRADIASQLPLRRHCMYVASKRSRTRSVLPCIAAVGIPDGDVVDRLRVLAQQSVGEAELPHQIHLLLQVRRRAELRRPTCGV